MTNTTTENTLQTKGAVLPPLSNLALMLLSEIPRIGQPWPGQGGLFAGLVRGRDGAPDYLLILGPEYGGELNWQAAMDWVKGIEIDGHADFSLPTRVEQSILFGNVGDKFKGDWYWSCEQHAEDAGYAWVQTFNYGYQGLNLKDGEWRARAVRRLIIQ